jgi:FKBP-type peptidyl-prolyl cis-trans isomerase
MLIFLAQKGKRRAHHVRRTVHPQTRSTSLALSSTAVCVLALTGIMAPPKTTLDKIVVAVTTLADPTGSSRQAIVKFLKTEFQLENAAIIKKALKQGVDKGKLTQQGQSFSVPGVEFEIPKDEQVTIEEILVGDGAVAERGADVTMKYRGTLESDGSEFDAASRFDFTLGAGEVIKGWDKGIEGMRVGGKRKLVIPSKLGYGKRGSPPEIPGDATLVFDVELLAVE